MPRPKTIEILRIIQTSEKSDTQIAKDFGTTNQNVTNIRTRYGDKLWSEYLRNGNNRQQNDNPQNRSQNKKNGLSLRVENEFKLISYPSEFFRNILYFCNGFKTPKREDKKKTIKKIIKLLESCL